MIPIRETAQGVTFSVRVQPGAKRDAVTGVYGEGVDAALKVAIAAPAIDGRANQALVKFFADLFAVPRQSIEILSGEQSRSKVVRIAGKTAGEVSSELIPYTG